MKDYSLVLCPLHSDFRDFSGTKYPKKGYVRCQNFKDDYDINTGLYGYRWRVVNLTNILDDGIFAVVRLSEQSITVDEYLNAVKFEQGYVIFVGNRDDCLAKLKEDRVGGSPEKQAKI